MNKEKFFEEFFEGNCLNAYEYLGAHVSGKKTVFVTYAPNAAISNLIGRIKNSLLYSLVVRQDFLFSLQCVYINYLSAEIYRKTPTLFLVTSACCEYKNFMRLAY